VAAWLSRLAVAVFSMLAVGFAGGVVLGASSAETQAMQLVATCLSCGEQWFFTPSATIGTGMLSFLLRRGKKPDKCPKCGSRAVAFAHPGHAGETDAAQ
jgi:predicted nucleic-acid-binding Zn-ribbon protein